MHDVKSPVFRCALSYHGRLVRSDVLRRPGDDRSFYRLHYISIAGRDDPARYEWDRCLLDPDDVHRRLAAEVAPGVGFVMTFPHITKIFRYAPEAETLLQVRALDTATGAPIDLVRTGGFVEFACLAESLVAAEEHGHWAAASSVEDYAARRIRFEEASILDPAKMRRHWEGMP